MSPDSNHIKALEDEARRYREALELIENCGRPGDHNDPVPYHRLRSIARSALHGRCFKHDLHVDTESGLVRCTKCGKEARAAS